eukprot:CAMPEP_0184038134 /NCGR_PEP_ID=MMETSP0955-20130417/45027_1 /TAXON_ID=627963 /ORGANISM="Aplanochytrium sp, Strain PBS07" /LENGTH=66 /DNA_ID=CAMNT_0026326613 /DNA_START=184 /DNA_END=384 /DNA_ORIENTATION=-
MDVYDLAIKFGLSTQGDSALQLFHEQGLIIHLTVSETLQNITMIKPRGLIDSLAKVNCDPGIHVDV